ncbi:hypothetical protein [Hydrogenophaga pseudoflava]|uniref:hypothetical protein n=1 Tax=Hydrogenophaga pseudoflava TaxID=47421 RepID=UPI0027E3CAAF|nr:hypothetical protein [Hydrogenophaga pseudoflava]MDQ7744202.1 hypothetical protein [Hydrogenophaga pseudoflava]
MITVHHAPRWPTHDQRVFAAFSFRYDAQLVPDLLANIQPMVDGWVAWDDRSSKAFYSDEPTRRHALLQAAQAASADWVLAVDPDERFEAGLSDAMASLTQVPGPLAYSFAVREMYSPLHYRVDGVWGTKRQTRLFRLPPQWQPQPRPLHTPWDQMIPQVKIIETDFNLYHLKMLTPERRRARAALYTHLDPEWRYQPIGYDYLADDSGALLEAIPHAKAYLPPHVDDGGLWMPPLRG